MDKSNRVRNRSGNNKSVGVTANAALTAYNNTLSPDTNTAHSNAARILFARLEMDLERTGQRRFG